MKKMLTSNYVVASSNRYKKKHPVIYSDIVRAAIRDRVNEEKDSRKKEAAKRLEDSPAGNFAESFEENEGSKGGKVGTGSAGAV